MPSSKPSTQHTQPNRAAWNYDLEAAPKGILLDLLKAHGPAHERGIYRGHRYANSNYFTAGLGYLSADAWRLPQD